MVLKRIDVLSAGKVLGAVYALFGLIGSFFFVLAGLFMAVVSGDGGGEIAVGLIGFVLIALFFPVAQGVAGFLGGLLGALLYNLVASLVGGIEFDLERTGPGRIE